MYPFTDTKYTTKYSKGIKNTCQYIILHHTGGGSYQSNLRYLTESPAQASVHFIVGPDEEVAKCGEPTRMMWHAGTSQRGNLTNMNKYSLGIEIVGYGEYNTKQFIRVTDLVEYLMAVYKIPRENVLTHADICQKGDFSKNKILRDGKRPSRKVDVAKSFFPMGFETWRNQLTPRSKSRYN